MDIVMLIIIFILGCFFPAFLIDAIRADEESVSDDKRTKACLTFALLAVAFVYIIINA